MTNRIAWPLLSLSQVLLFSGCGILIGNVKPVEEKSEGYQVMDLSRERPADWSRVTDSLQADEVFQSQKNSAVIAVNSSCRKNEKSGSSKSAATGPKLRKLSEPLHLGMTDVTLKHERPLRVNGLPALETTVVGKMALGSGAPVGPVVLQSIVMEQAECTYQLLSVSRPEVFPQASDDFILFVRSFKIVKNG